MSQPGVSRAIGALQGELGGELFLRGRGSVVLTTLGERALPGICAPSSARPMPCAPSAMSGRGSASGRVRRSEPA
ncbi:MAG: LysR family transcriptional regulator [Actinomycetota bacterium]|nr:LysR family transcriptional regulator [Actinomycetota bacterium]